MTGGTAEGEKYEATGGTQAGTKMSGNTLTLDPAEPDGTVTVTYTATVNGKAVSDTATVTVKAKPAT